MLKTLRERLGPGLLYAATAVGVSHLVQSTRAGATYGMIMAGYVVFMCLLKYPTFLFGARYAAATGETLVDGYERLGRWILYLFFFIQLFEFTFGIAGVAVVTAGLVKSVFVLQVGDIPMAIGLTIACLAVLAVGRYALLEDITKLLVVTFSVGTVLAALVAVVGIDPGGAALSAPLTLDAPTILFLVAVAGWMPTGTAGSVSISLWVKAKQQRERRAISLREAEFDFNLGYFTAIFTAVCFVALGAYVMLLQGEPPLADSAGFAAQLIGLFTGTLGSWAYLIIAVAAITVMISTLLTLVDLLPRTSAAVLTRLAPEAFGPGRQNVLYLAFIGIELLLLIGVLLLLMDSFATFIDLVTSMGFIVAPVIALLNHVAMFTLAPPERRPGRILKAWSWVTVVSLTFVAVLFVYLRTA